MNIEHFLTNAVPAGCMMEDNESDIVISTRIRLARNLLIFDFQLVLQRKKQRNVEEQVMQALLSYK